MLKKLPYKKDDDLLWKVEKAIELMETDEVGPINLLEDLKILKELADGYIQIEIALDDFSEVRGRPESVEAPVISSRIWFYQGFREIETALERLIYEFERFDF